MNNNPNPKPKDEGMTGMCFWYQGQVVANHDKVLFDPRTVENGKSQIDIAAIGRCLIDRWVKFGTTFHIHVTPLNTQPAVA